METKISIDNLTFVGTPIESAVFVLKKQIMFNHYETPVHAIYHHNFKSESGVFVQVTHESSVSPSIRLEFNPNKITKGEEKGLFIILKLIKRVDVHLTRIDIAFDIFGEKLSDWKVIDYKSRKRNYFTDSKLTLETLYLGSNKSREQIRIYDKAKEQKDNTGQIWWRVEVQLRGEYAQYFLDYNPFIHIQFIKEKKLEGYDLKTRAIVELLQREPELLKELSVNTRGKYKQLMGATSEQLKLNFASDYEEKKEDLREQVNSWLSFCDEY